MNCLKKKPSRNREIDDIRTEGDAQAANQLLVGVTLLAIVSVPVSLTRALSFGWSHFYWVQILCMLAVTALCLFRHRASTHFKATTVLLLSLLVALGGLLSYGIYASGPIWGIFAIFVAAMFMNRKVVIVVAAGYVLTLVAIGYAFVAGYLAPIADPVLYIRTPAAWATAIVGSLFFLILIIAIDANHRQTTKRLFLELEKKRKQLEMVADHDPLTGLPNLRALKAFSAAIVADSAENQATASVFFVDLDGFKAINDRHGHDAGDHVLKNVASALLAIVRNDDMVARIGGDEFFIFLRCPVELPPPNPAEFAQRIITAVSTPVFLHANELKVGASVGVTQVTPGDSYDTLLKRADAAMYAAKRGGKNTYRFDGK